MSKISNGALEMARRGAKKYRAYLKMRGSQGEVRAPESRPWRHGGESTFRDYRDAFEQTGCCVEEYFLFQFYLKDRAERDTYLTYDRRYRFIQAINDDQTTNATVPGNKVLFNMLFDKYLAREWITPPPPRRRRSPPL